MFKRILLSGTAAALLAFFIPLSVSASGSAVKSEPAVFKSEYQGFENSSPARPGPALRVVVNGVTVSREKDMLITETPFVPLRAVCERLGAAVRWNDIKHEAKVSKGGNVYVLNGVILDGRLMVNAETVASVFGLNARYEPSLNTISLSGGASPSKDKLQAIISTSGKYSKDDVYWLSRIVEAEARGENFDSRLAVANVVLNRKESGIYPDTVKEVIFDKKHGVQFTPVANGAVYNNPSGLSLLAALDALDGFNNVPGALFFMDPSQAQTLWIEDNRQMAFTVGAHTYYY